MNLESATTGTNPAPSHPRRSLVALIGLAGLGALALAGQADAQWQRAAPSNSWQWTNDKGETKVSQYKLDIPAQYRDGAVWIGPTGVGKPKLSEDQQVVRGMNEDMKQPAVPQSLIRRTGKEVRRTAQEDRKQTYPGNSLSIPTGDAATASGR